MPSSSSEKRLVPSIHVTIHPTVAKEKKKESSAVSDETQETASDQEVVEKLIGAKITGGIEFNMPLTIFDVIEKKIPFVLSYSLLIVESHRCFCAFFSRLSKNQKRVESDWSWAMKSSQSRASWRARWAWKTLTRNFCSHASTSEASNCISCGKLILTLTRRIQIMSNDGDSSPPTAVPTY